MRSGDWIWIYLSNAERNHATLNKHLGRSLPNWAISHDAPGQHIPLLCPTAIQVGCKANRDLQWAKYNQLISRVQIGLRLSGKAVWSCKLYDGNASFIPSKLHVLLGLHGSSKPVYRSYLLVMGERRRNLLKCLKKLGIPGWITG